MNSEAGRGQSVEGCGVQQGDDIHLKGKETNFPKEIIVDGLKKRGVILWMLEGRPIDLAKANGRKRKR